MPTKILIIEDDRDILDNIVDCLEAEGFEVVSAMSGNEGVSLVAITRPDLILCDRSMPDGDGDFVLASVRANPKFAQTPFIFITAKATKDELRDGMTQGADDYLTKPFTRTELLGAIYAQLEKAAARAADTKAKMAIVSEAVRTHLQHIYGNLELYREDNPDVVENEEFRDARNATILAIAMVEKLMAAMVAKQR